MRTETCEFSTADERRHTALLWLPDTDPIGIVQITHGMTEHMGRWEPLASALTASGIAVGGFTLRGHGMDEVVPQIAVFGENDWEATIEDMHGMFLQLKQRFPTIPHLMLGFSLGSFLLREYLNRYPDGISGVALLGTGQQKGIVLRILQAIIQTQIRKAGWHATTPLVQKISFETYNRSFAPNRTAADWLCADEDQLNAYLTDPLCRSHISAGLFWHLLGGMKRCGTNDGCKNWNTHMPVLLMSGEEDPVGDRGKGVRAVQAQLHKTGLSQVELHLLPKARHDLLHEEDSGAGPRAREILTQWAQDICQAPH